MKTSTTILAALFTAASLHAAVIEQVIVRQQWPWSTDVKVEYKLADVSSPVDISVEAYNGNEKLDDSRLVAAMTGDRFGIAEDGVGTIVIDPVKAFGTQKVALANFRVKLTLSDSAANMQDVLYRILDLEANPVTYTDVRRADFYNGTYGDFVTSFTDIGKLVGDNNFSTSLSDVLIWTGVTNNPAYKTTKLVLRRIPAGGKHFYMGADGLTNDEIAVTAQYTITAAERYRVKVSFTNDFWLGVFEVTQKQYALLTGGNASSIADADAVKPQVDVTYKTLRGTPMDWSAWPANVYEVTQDSKIQAMRDRLPGLIVDLPTEAQWEYACRAGTVDQLYNGYRITGANSVKAALANMSWTSETKGGEDSKEAGLLLPNAFGLYDMLGNAVELVRDIFDPASPSGGSSPSGPAPPSGDSTEPMGWTDGAAAAVLGPSCKALYRGGNTTRNYTFSHVACRREWNDLNARYGVCGFRLWMYAD